MATNDVQEYIERIRPLFAEGYRLARLTAGGQEWADAVMQRAVLEAYVYRRDLRERMGFREGFFHVVRKQALKARREAGGAAPFEEAYLQSLWEGTEGAEAALRGRAGRETPEARRLLFLHYGCALSPRQIARVLGTGTGEVAARLRLLRARMARAAGKRGGRVRAAALEDKLEGLFREALRAPGEDVPDMGELLAQFEGEARRAARPRLSAGRAVRVVLYVLSALVCAALFWLFAVLLEPQGVVRNAPVAAVEEVRNG